MTQMSAQSFKVHFNGETRRIPAHNLTALDIASFTSSLTSLFPSAQKVVVQYTDADGDQVTVRSTDELTEAFLALTGPCKSFTLREDGTNVSRSPHPVAVCRLVTVGRPVKGTPPNPTAGSDKKKPHQQRPKEAMEESARLTASGQPTEARDLLARTVEAFPHAALAWVRLAAAHSALGSTSESLDAFERGVAEGFGNIKLSLSDEGLKAIRSHPRFIALILSMAKGKFEKEGRKEGATLGGFLASKVLFFRTTGVKPADALAFANACLDDPKVDKCPMLLYQSSVTAAASGEGALSVDLLRRAAEAGFRFPGKVKNEPAFDCVRPQLDGLVRAIHANKRATDPKGEKPSLLPQTTTVEAAANISAPPPEDQTVSQPTHPELPILRALGFAAPDSVLVDLLEKHDGDVSLAVAALLDPRIIDSN